MFRTDHWESWQYVAVPVQAMRQPYSVAYDPVDKMVCYWFHMPLLCHTYMFMYFDCCKYTGQQFSISQCADSITSIKHVPNITKYLISTDLSYKRHGISITERVFRSRVVTDSQQ